MINLRSLAARRFVVGNAFDGRFCIRCILGAEIVSHGQRLAYRSHQVEGSASLAIIDRLKALPGAEVSDEGKTVVISFSVGQFEEVCSIVRPRTSFGGIAK